MARGRVDLGRKLGSHGEKESSRMWGYLGHGLYREARAHALRESKLRRVTAGVNRWAENYVKWASA